MSTYKLQYFDARGVAESCRFLFAMAKQPYEDARFPFTFGTPGDFSTIQRPEFDAAKAAGDLDPAMGKVPLLTVDGVSFGQSKAIERFLAQRFGFMGSSDVEAARIDQLCEQVRDIKDAYNKAKNGADKDEALAKFKAEGMPGNLAAVERSLGASEWMVGDKPSLADVTYFLFLGDESKPFFDDREFAAAVSACPKIQAAINKIGAMPEVQEWIAKRPDTMF